MASTQSKSSTSSGSRAKPAKQTGPAAQQANSGVQRIGEISSATSRIVQEAGAILDDEMAIGIMAAKKMQDRFDNERRVELTDFNDALQRWQHDGHELVSLVNQQISALRSDENVDLTNRLITDIHSLLDLAVGLVGTGTEVANHLIERHLPKPGGPPEKP